LLVKTLYLFNKAAKHFKNYKGNRDLLERGINYLFLSGHKDIREIMAYFREISSMDLLRQPLLGQDLSGNNGKKPNAVFAKIRSLFSSSKAQAPLKGRATVNNTPCKEEIQRDEKKLALLNKSEERT